MDEDARGVRGGENKRKQMQFYVISCIGMIEVDAGTSCPGLVF